MKRSYRKIILRTFKSTRSRFASIFAIVALGVGFLAGLSATPVDMRRSMEQYMDGANFYDLRVVGTLGLTDADVTALQAVPGVQAVQPGYAADLMVQAGEDVVVGRAHSLPPEGEAGINRLSLVAGRLPQNDGECVVEAGPNAAHPTHAIGEILRAQPADGLCDKLCTTEFTIVGIVHNANYFSFEREPASVGNGTVGLVFYLPETAFAYEAYTELAVTVEDALAQDSLGDAYRATVAAVRERVEKIADAQCQLRYDTVRQDAQTELDDAWDEYNTAAADADKELADAAAELADGREKLADGQQELMDGEQELADGAQELAENEDKVEDGAAQLADALTELQSGEEEWKTGSEKLANSKPELDEALRKLQEGERQYADGAKALEDGENRLNAAKQQLDAAAQKLEEGTAQYAAGLAAYEENKKQLDAGKAELDAALPLLEKYENGVKQAEKGKKQYEQLCVLSTAETAYAAGSATAAAGIAAAVEPVDPAVPPLNASTVLAYFEAQAAQPAPATPETAAPGDTLLKGLAAYTDTALVWRTPDEAQRQGLSATAATLIATRRTLNAGLQGMVDSGAAPNREAAKLLLSPAALAAAKAKLDAADAELAAGKAEYEAGKAKYEAGYAKWKAGTEQLEAGKKTLDASGEALNAGRAQYSEGLAEWQAGKEEMQAGAAKLDAAKAELDAGRRQYDEGLAAYEDGQKKLTESRKSLTDGWATLTDKQLELDDARRKLNDARQTLAEGRQELEDARTTLTEKTQELRDGEIEYEDAKAEVAEKLGDARAKIEDGQSELDELEYPEWYVWERGNNVSFASFERNVVKLQAITTVFPIFFFLVAALVVSSTMTRMVDEERLQIGTLKALGYKPGEIIQKYIWYALAASAAGTLAGLAVGFYAFPTIIWSAYTMMYYMPVLYTPWQLDKAVFAGGSLTLLSATVTLLACRASLREVPAALLLPRAPKAGKRILLERITPLWRRLPFTYKVTARNLFRYKRRFWMTVLGVAGCTALLVTGFGISDSLDAVVTNQYERVYHYQLMTVLTDDATEAGSLHDALFENEHITESLAVSIENLSETVPDGSKVELYLMVPEDTAAFARYADLHERKTGMPTPLGETGVVVTEKLAALYGVSAGDTLRLTDGNGVQAEFTVSGVCEHYMYNYVYMSAAAYRAAFGTGPSYNAVLSRMADDSQTVRDALSAELLDFDTVAGVTFTQDSIQQVLNMLGTIDAVVVLIIVCAACLAFVVLYNLGNINIAERTKEIATIKVLGFYDREVSGYVNRESVALTLIGTVFGLGLGIVLHRFIIATVEVDAIMFGREIKPLSFAYAAALTLLFSWLVNLVMGRMLRRISMVESMKAPE